MNEATPTAGNFSQNGAAGAAPFSSSNLELDWPVPQGDMFYGLAGDVVHLFDPHTEADPVAVLIQFLAAYGSAIGRSAHFTAEADKHYCNLFAVLVGVSSKGRKGTSWGRVVSLFEAAEPTWSQKCIQTGLASGEGLIWAVRDPIEKQEKNKKTGDTETVTLDTGVEDKRLLIQASEFAAIMRVAGREGNTLSPLLRDAWDRGRLQSMTKNNAACATNAHISLIGHITADELRREIAGSPDATNGFANRFLWVCVKRSKELPEGGSLQSYQMNPVIMRLQRAIATGRTATLLRRDEEARAIWFKVYHDLSEGQPGLSGAVTSRGEAQVMRLALLYALLDDAEMIGRPHMKAALALWKYVEASALFVFGDSLNDPIATEIQRILRADPAGKTRDDLRQHFQRNQTSERIGQALETLRRLGRVRCDKQATQGRPAERWFAT